jgi:hypothetical protein
MPPSQTGNGNAFANAKRQYERYLALTKGASLSGDTVEARNFFQHGELFFRMMREQGA